MDADHEEKQELIQSLIESITDRFDTIQVFTTSHNRETGETTYIGMGTGNFYARIGQIKEWLQLQKDIINQKAKQIAEADGSEFGQN
jgi:predicted CoA-binding protein